MPIFGLGPSAMPTQGGHGWAAKPGAITKQRGEEALNSVQSDVHAGRGQDNYTYTGPPSAYGGRSLQTNVHGSYLEDRSPQYGDTAVSANSGRQVTDEAAPHLGQTRSRDCTSAFFGSSNSAPQPVPQGTEYHPPGHGDVTISANSGLEARTVLPPHQRIPGRAPIQQALDHDIAERNLIQKQLSHQGTSASLCP